MTGGTQWTRKQPCAPPSHICLPLQNVPFVAILSQQKYNNMTNCTEFVLDDAIAITAIPISDFNLGIIPWQITPTIPAEQFSPTLTHAITIGMSPETPGGTLIPIVRTTGKAKDEESDSVSGRLHTVTANCQVDDRNTTVWDNLLTLERTISHLIITFRDKTRGFVAATRDTYLFTPERDGAKTAIQFRIQNFMGIQMIL